MYSANLNNLRIPLYNGTDQRSEAVLIVEEHSNSYFGKVWASIYKSLGDCDRGGFVVQLFTEADPDDIGGMVFTVNRRETQQVEFHLPGDEEGVHALRALRAALNKLELPSGLDDFT